ncbi:MAG TPA: maleylpyruvate isomerase N-terminal domain-containing protein [Actinomycetota bacterium]|jgi:Mycothiol maleylpyruvate isomerase N-terminal domain|nr:maleylpyruvate isomerase N-terminal domain-containing protein [Actinomycetota bacterium]
MEDRSYIDTNLRGLERLRNLVEGADEDALTAPVNEYWSVAGVLAHMAWWDARVVVFADKIDRGDPWVPTDEEPEGDWLNDTTRLVIEGLAPHAPRAAAELALRMAERADARVAELPLDRMAPRDPASPISPDRADHRVEHLDEIEAVLERRA